MIPPGGGALRRPSWSWGRWCARPGHPAVRIAHGRRRVRPTAGQADVLPQAAAPAGPRLVHGAVALIDWGGGCWWCAGPTRVCWRACGSFRGRRRRRPPRGPPWPERWPASRAVASGGAELARVGHVFQPLGWRLRIFACPRVGEEGPPRARAGPPNAAGRLPGAGAAGLGRAHRRIGEHWLAVTTASPRWQPLA